MDTTECKWSYAGNNNHREFVLPGPFKKDGVTGKKVCMDCCRFLGWVWSDKLESAAKPKSVSPNMDMIHLLNGKFAEMSEWEQKFIKDISKRTVLTEKQVEHFNRIRSKFFELPNETQHSKEVENVGVKQSNTITDDDDFLVPF